MKEFQSKIYNLRNETTTHRAVTEAFVVDYLKVAQSILSKQLPAERYNGIINLEYVLAYPNATTDETESALVTCINHFFEFFTAFNGT